MVKLRDFLSCGGGSSDVLFGIPIFGNKHFRSPWFQRTVWPAYRLARKLSDARYWVLYRTTRRDLWTIKTGLVPNYYDVDTLMLHGCMQLLCRYVEDEMGGAEQIEKFSAELRQPGSEGHGPREAVEGQASTQESALSIYKWWKIERRADEARHDELLHILYGNERMSWKPVTDPTLDGKDFVEAVFKEFEGDEIAMNEEFRRIEKKIADDEQRMLHALIDIRRSLWT